MPNFTRMLANAFACASVLLLLFGAFTVWHSFASFEHENEAPFVSPFFLG